MTETLARTPASPTEAEPGARPSTTPQYRSVADGELRTTWTLSEYFSSLNSVLRLPSRARRNAAAAAQGTPAGQQALALFDRIRIPPALIAAGVAVAALVLVVRPLVLAASGGGADLTPAYGVWQAGKGKYEGRTFQVVAGHVSFATRAKDPDYTWHAIREVRAKAAGDSTYYTVVYGEQGKQAEFSFWYHGGQPAVIHVAHQSGVTWTRLARSPTAPPAD